MGYIRMIRSGGLHCCSNAIRYIVWSKYYFCLRNNNIGTFNVYELFWIFQCNKTQRFLRSFLDVFEKYHDFIIVTRRVPTLPLVSQRNAVWGTKSKIPYLWRLTTQVWVLLLISWAAKLALASQVHYPDLTSNTSSVWNFCFCYSNVISLGNQW